MKLRTLTDHIRTTLHHIKYSRAIVLALLLALPTIVLPGITLGSGQPCSITLTNGNTVTVNSYTINGDEILLRFRVGEASIPVSEVVSIVSSDGSVTMLQERGSYIPGADDTARAAEPSDEYTGNSWDAIPARASVTTPLPSATNNPATHSDRRWESVYASPQTGEVDEFIDEFFLSSETGTDMSDEEVDRALSSFFGDEAINGKGGSDSLDE